VKWPIQRDVKLLHYKRLGFDRLVNRYAELKRGLRPLDFSYRWGEQYLMMRSELKREFDEFGRRASPVPGLNGRIDPDLRLVVDGYALHPTEVSHNTYTFVLRTNGEVFRLVSNVGTAQAARAPSAPTSRGGVPVARIFVRSATEVYGIMPDEPCLADGWSDIERIGSVQIRWTDGDALVPIPPHARPIDAVEVTLRWPLTL
jgi:hypothetical protein